MFINILCYILLIRHVISPQAFAAVQGGGTYVQPTLIARDVRLQRTLGQRQEFSFYDAKLANLAYCRGEKETSFKYFK